MAMPGIKYDTGKLTFGPNCFPVRNSSHYNSESSGAWIAAQTAEQRRRFKAILSSKPRTFDQIRAERIKSVKKGTQISFQSQSHQEPEEHLQEQLSTLDGFLLMKHCCVNDPSDLCSVNINGLGLTDVRADDFALFDNVAYMNSSENYLNLASFKNFSLLRELELSLNGIRGVEVNPGDFPHLQSLDLSYNNLDPDDLLPLGYISNLRALTLTGNSLTTLPQTLVHPQFNEKVKRKVVPFPNLEVLLLDDNQLSDVSVFTALAGFSALSHLSLSKNQLCAVPELTLVNDGDSFSAAPSGRATSDRSTGRHSNRQSGLHSNRSSKPSSRVDRGQAKRAGEKESAVRDKGSAGARRSAGGVRFDPALSRDVTDHVLELGVHGETAGADLTTGSHAETDLSLSPSRANRDSSQVAPSNSLADVSAKSERTSDLVTDAAIIKTDVSETQVLDQDVTLHQDNGNSKSQTDRVSSYAYDQTSHRSDNDKSTAHGLDEDFGGLHVLSESKARLLGDGGLDRVNNELDQELRHDSSYSLPPPFHTLTRLDLSHNKIEREAALLPLATWPRLSELIIHDNPLTSRHSGDPPILKSLLQDRLSVRLVRKQPPPLAPPHIDVPNKPRRKIRNRILPVPRCNPDKLLALESAHAALKGSHDNEPDRAVSPTLDPASDVVNEQSMDLTADRGSGFFVTQPLGGEEFEADDATKTVVSETRDLGTFPLQPNFPTVKPLNRKNKKNAFETQKLEPICPSNEDDPYALIYRDDDLFNEACPKKASESHSAISTCSDAHTDIQSNVRALAFALNHPLVYRDPISNLDHRKLNPLHKAQQTKADSNSRLAVEEAKVNQGRTERLLETLRDNTAVREAALVNALQKGSTEHRPEAKLLLAQLKKQYRVSPTPEDATSNGILSACDLNQQQQQQRQQQQQ